MTKSSKYLIISCLLVIFGDFSSLATFAINPTKDYILTPDSFNLSFEKKHFITKDSANIYAWIIKPTIQSERNNKVIVICPSDAGNMSYFLYQAYAMVNVGYYVVMFDYRGFGTSSDFSYQKNNLYHNEDITDALTVLRKVKSTFKEKKIGLMGFSMGTIIATFVSQQEKVDFMINEGLVSNLNKYVEHLYQIKHKKILLPSSSKKYNNIFLNSLTKLPKYLIFIGNNDKNSQLNEQQLKDNKVEIIKFDGGHLQAFTSLTKTNYGDEYVKIINKFMDHLEDAK